jgi:hypothetical protein
MTSPGPAAVVSSPRPSARARLLRAFFCPRDPSDPDAGLRPRWLRWGAVAAAALAGLYAAGAAGVYAFNRYHRDVHGARLVDVLAPWRWDRFRAAQGNELIVTAVNLARAGQLREALMHARTGLAQSPLHRGGRLLLAQLLVQAQRVDDARLTLLGGLELHARDPVYLLPVFTFLLQRQDDSQAIALAHTVLQQTPGNAHCNRLAALAGATASYLRGKYDQAEDFLRATPQLDTSRDGRLLLAKIDGERGYRELALVRLRGLAAELPGDNEVHAELVRRLRQAGLGAEARRRTLAFQIAHPHLASSRLELLRAYHEHGDGAAAAREAAEFLRDFAADSFALIGLADFAAATGNAALARQVAEHATVAGLPVEPFAFLFIEGLLVARDYTGALDSAQSLLRQNTGMAQRYSGLFDSLQAVAHHGLGNAEATRLFLTSFLQQPALRAENLLALANRFVALDAELLARRILERAVALDPLNQAALTRLIELDLSLDRIDELPAHLRRLAGMRRPSPDLLRVAQHRLGSDLFLFSPERGPALDAVRAALERATGVRPAVSGTGPAR